ncbi:MAG: DUF4388 domain-containing protein [Acidobacteriota bacterium]
MALEGTLKDFALPDIFQLIGLQKKTGTLFLKNEEHDEVTITFLDGCLVFADSKNKRLEGRLGTMLVRAGLITEVQLMQVLEKQKQTLQRLGVLLVNEGVVRQDDLKKALQLQVTQIIYKVFRWDDGDYRFDQEDQIDYDRDNVTPISAESILMEGMQIIDEWPMIEKVVPNLLVVLEKAPVDMPIEVEKPYQEEDDDDDFDFDLSGGGAKEEKPTQETIKLSSDEGAVYELVDGSRQLEDIMYLARLSEFDISKVAHDLINRDLLRLKGQQAAASDSASSGMSVETRREIPGAVLVALNVLLGILVLCGAAFFWLNPLNSGPWAGVRSEDLAAQSKANLNGRLTRIGGALELHRLAQGDQRYAVSLEELTDLGYLTPADLEGPAGESFDYQPKGDDYLVKVVDADGSAIVGLERRSALREVAVSEATSTETDETSTE